MLRGSAEPRLPMNPVRHRKTARRLVAAVLLAMLVGQWLTLAHGVAHARTGSALAGAAAPADSNEVWGHYAGTSACHLVDHLLTGQAPGSNLASMPGLPPAAVTMAVAAASNAPGPGSRPYEARGPPAA